MLNKASFIVAAVSAVSIAASCPCDDNKINDAIARGESTSTNELSQVLRSQSGLAQISASSSASLGVS